MATISKQWFVRKKIYDKSKGATQTNARLKRVASAKLGTERKQLCGVFCGVLWTGANATDLKRISYL